MCAWCVHMWHIRHMGDFRIFFEKIRFFRIFVEFQNFSKNFPKIFFVKNRQNIVSFRSYARLNKIEAKYVILEHFEIFRFLKIFQKFQKCDFFSKIWKISKCSKMTYFASILFKRAYDRNETMFCRFLTKKNLENFLKNFGNPQKF